jgi:hypothetical protein
MARLYTPDAQAHPLVTTRAEGHSDKEALPVRQAL